MQCRSVFEFCLRRHQNYEDLVYSECIDIKSQSLCSHKVSDNILMSESTTSSNSTDGIHLTAECEDVESFIDNNYHLDGSNDYSLRENGPLPWRTRDTRPLAGMQGMPCLPVWLPGQYDELHEQGDNAEHNFGGLQVDC